MYDPDRLHSVIYIGQINDKNATVLQFACSNWFAKWPNGLISATFMPPCGTLAREIADGQLTREGDVVSLTVSRDMTRVGGVGSICLALKDGGNIEKRSTVMNVLIGEPPPQKRRFS